MNILPKINKSPVNTREMLEWGMISYKTFKIVQTMTLDEAKQYCDNLGLYQSWSFPAEAIIEHFREHRIIPLDRMDFIKKVMVITDGKVSPPSVDVAWNRISGGLV